MGERAIREVRRKREDELGDDFDVRRVPQATCCPARDPWTTWRSASRSWRSRKKILRDADLFLAFCTAACIKSINEIRSNGMCNDCSL